MQKRGETETDFLLGSTKDKQSITSDWVKMQNLISGVQLKEVKNVMVRDGGYLTEIFRRDWNLGDTVVDQVFQRFMEPGAISGWHVHQKTTDRLFVSYGVIKIVLYDAREDSATFGSINEFCLGTPRPALVIIPPGIWHAVKNLSNNLSSLINLVDKAYLYEDPDHWRLPLNTDKIPYKF